MKRVTNTANNPHFEWVGGGNPNAILAQEAQGQKELMESDQLPVECNSHRELDTAIQYAAMGIKVKGKTPGDPLFLDVVLPAGWKKEATDHSMWNNLKDDKGRTRATFFYKAAFYDRKAMVNFLTRYRLEEEYFESEKNPEVEWDTARRTNVVDSTNDAVIFSSEKYFYQERAAAEKVVWEWMDKNYPDWRSITAYWE